MVTLKEVARECGLSVTAVSKALRGQKDISQSTIDRVESAAKRLGYIKNPAAVRLKTNRSYTFGVLLDDEADLGVEHEYFASILNPFMSNAKERGYSVMFVTDRVRGVKSSYKEFTQANGIDGVLILTADFEDEMIIELAQSDVPIVTIDYVFNNNSAILSDNESGMIEMVRYAYKMGHRKIAFIHGAPSPVTKIRLAAFHAVCSELNIEVQDGYILKGRYHDSEYTEKLTYQLLDQDDPPTFIFYPDDISFVGGMNALDRRGMSYPEDISVAGYDGIRFSQNFKPRLMTWKQNTVYVGKTAVDLLINAVENPKTYLPRIYSAKGTLCEGQSVKKIN